MSVETGTDDIRRFIVAVAKRAARDFVGSFNDLDDYIQVGEIARWRASEGWNPKKGSIGGYVRAAILHEIMTAAIGSQYPVTAPVKVKRLAMRVRGLRTQGLSDQQIMTRTGLDRSRLAQFGRMSAPVRRLSDHA